MKRADVVICGAGIAGISAAYHLTVQAGIKDVLLIDERPPLSLTSDKSTECYRNWWPGPGDAMVSMTNRSIDILEDLARHTGNLFQLNRRGYLFATAEPARINDFLTQGREAEALGAGPLRIHDGRSGSPAYQPAPLEGFENQPVGADLVTHPELIREHFPYLSEETVAVVHPRRCGWFSAQQLGMYMLQEALQNGATLVDGRVVGIERRGGKVVGVRVATKEGESRIDTPNFVLAAGPLARGVAKLLEIDLPVSCELHGKISFSDHRELFPRSAPLVIWTDPQHLPWTAEERTLLAEDPESKFLLEPFPQGVHARPEGPEDSPVVLMLWTYDMASVEPTFPPTFDQTYPEIVLRGLSTMIPALRQYFQRMPKPFVDGGYYAKTQENRPLVGPLPVKGAWILGALSGFGQMAGPACGELLSSYLIGSELPGYARWFRLDRYEDPDYQKLLKNWGRSGQL